MTTAVYPVDDKNFYRVYEVDRTGKELKDTDDGKLVSTHLLEEVKNDVTDVVIACHGWNTVQKHDDSVHFYDKLFKQIVTNEEELEALRNVRPNLKFQFIGVHWPSAPIRFLTGSKRSSPTEEGLAQIQTALAQTDPIAASKLDNLLKDLKSSSPDDLKESEDLEELPENVRKDFLEMLDAMEPEEEARIGLDGGQDHESLEGKSLFRRSAKAAKEAKEEEARKQVEKEAREDEEKAARKGEEKGSTADNAEKDEGNTTKEQSQPSPVFDFFVRATFGLAERLVFGRFEERAIAVGATGIHSLLAKLQKAAAPITRFHLIGHSLGCHLVNAALIGSPRYGNNLVRKVHSVVLLQGAVPYRCYAKGQLYRAISSKWQPVAGPILVTTSQADNALHSYRQFHGHPLGHKGAVDAGPLSTINLELQHCTFPYGLRKKHIYNFKADKYIDMTEGVFGIDLDGAHGDVFDKEVIHCMFEAWRVKVNEDEYRLARVPHDYFTDVDKQREKIEGGGCVVS